MGCPCLQPPTKFGPFMVDDQPGEQWIKLKSKFGDQDIKVEVSMFDGAAPAPKSGGGEEDMQLHITFIVSISKGENGDVLEILCSAWPDTIEIQRLFLRKCDNNNNNKKKIARSYSGPAFK